MMWSPAKDRALTKLVDRELKIQDIAVEIGATRHAVAARLRFLGIKGKAKRSYPLNAPKMPDRKPRQWTAAEDARLTSMHADGQPFWKIAKALHVATTTASMRARVVGLIPPVSHDEIPFRPERFACGHCGTRSDAALDFGCGHCLPLRREAA